MRKAKIAVIGIFALELTTQLHFERAKESFQNALEIVEKDFNFCHDLELVNDEIDFTQVFLLTRKNVMFKPFKQSLYKSLHRRKPFKAQGYYG